MNTTTTQRIDLADTLKNNRDGNKYGTCTVSSLDSETNTWNYTAFEVKVEPQSHGRLYRVYVKDASDTETVGGYFRLAGVLEKVAVGRWRLHFTNPETGNTEPSYTDHGTIAHYAHVVVSHFVGSAWYHAEQARKAAQPAEVTEITLTEEQAEQVVNNDPAPSGRHLRALVTVEVAERLTARAYSILVKAEEAMRLAQPGTAMALISEAKDYLGEVTDATTTTTASQVKSLETSDAIAAKARKQVRAAHQRIISDGE